MLEFLRKSPMPALAFVYEGSSSFGLNCVRNKTMMKRDKANYNDLSKLMKYGQFYLQTSDEPQKELDAVVTSGWTEEVVDLPWLSEAQLDTIKNRVKTGLGASLTFMGHSTLLC